jgi:Copper amine oxidase, enzyme domain
MRARKTTTRAKTSLAAGESLTVTLKPFGPTPEKIQSLAQSLPAHRVVQEELAGTRHRLLRIDLLDAPGDTKSASPKPPERFQATFVDYTNNRTVFATGNLSETRTLKMTESALQPRPSEEEFQEAVSLVMRDTEVGPAARGAGLRPYRPMPPLVGEELGDGRVERTVAVGLLPRDGSGGHEIVGVNMAKRKLVRFEPSERGHAPLMSAAHNPICGLPYAAQDTASGVAGSAWVTVKQGTTTLWKFLVVRPAASSGTNGSGVELRGVDYRGKRLLYRAHVPILNVKYDDDACGPYRDWQNQEGMISATGADVVPGFRLCPAPATTILESGSDVGNFLGVAIFVMDQEVVLVSEMEAGWYRYVSRWRLHADGTIRPRFGFSAVESSCVCNVHHHHAYWRLDFDVGTAGDNLIQEFNDPPLSGTSKWHNLNYEIRRARNPGRKRRWRVKNKSTGEAYDIIPGAHDGVATAMPDWPFARGDAWFLRYRGSEIDDGVFAVGPPYEAGLDAWVNGEPLNGKDVVVWYGAHFSHDVNHEEPGEFGHIVGPELKLVKW